MSDIDNAALAALTAATAAVLISKDRHQEAEAVLDAYDGPVGPLMLSLALLAGRGVRRGENVSHVVSALHKESIRMQARANRTAA